MSDEEGEQKSFVEGWDFYYEGSLMVLTREYLLRRGYCCENGCRNCPYGNAPSEKEDL